MARLSSVTFWEAFARLALRSLISACDLALISPVCLAACASSSLILASRSAVIFLACATASSFFSTV